MNYTYAVSRRNFVLAEYIEATYLTDREWLEVGIPKSLTDELLNI